MPDTRDLCLFPGNSRQHTLGVEGVVFMTPVRFHHVAAVVALVLIVPFAAACGSSGGETADTPGTSSLPVSTAAASVTEAVTTTVFVAPSDASELFGRSRAALSREGKVTHITMAVATEIVSPAETQQETVEAWWDPTLPVVRVERRMSSESEAMVGFLDAHQGLGNDEPTGLVLLYLLASQPEAALTGLPAGFTLRTDVENGGPVTVVGFQLPEGYESPAQTVTVTFDADNHPSHEERKAVGEDAWWTTKSIIYQTEFVDPASLPDGYFDAVTAMPPDTLPGGGAIFDTPEEFAERAAELVPEGLQVAWLGREYRDLVLGSIWYEPAGGEFTSPVIHFSYDVPADPAKINLTLYQTAMVNWPALQSYALLEGVDATGEPVPGIGERAYLATTGLVEGQSRLVVFDRGLVVVLEAVADTTRIPAADAKALVLEAARALRPFGPQ
jgi:hypothetical protein